MTTLYEKTIDFIRQLMDDAHMVPGDRLPSEQEITRMTGVSLMTVRRAMAELVNDGVLTRVQGRGTFVRSNRVHTDSTIIGGLKETLSLQGTELHTSIKSLRDVEATREQSDALRLAPGVKVWEIVRVRHLNGAPAVREIAVVPKILAPDLDAHFTSGEQSLYEVLATTYGLGESGEEQVLLVRVARPDEAHDLGISRGAFVIEITGVAATAGGTAFDAFQMVFIPQLFEFRLATSPTASVVDSN